MHWIQKSISISTEECCFFLFALKSKDVFLLRAIDFLPHRCSRDLVSCPCRRKNCHFIVFKMPNEEKEERKPLLQSENNTNYNAGGYIQGIYTINITMQFIGNVAYYVLVIMLADNGHR